MKAKAVSALRSKRGLRPVKQVAEPPVVGLAPQTTEMTERANTMKTYILRDPKTVEPQTPERPGRRPDPAVTATVNAIGGPPPATASGLILFIGLDVHTESIAVSLAPSESTEVRRYGIIGGTWLAHQPPPGRGNNSIS